jgi:hypothetical protein
MNTACCPWLAQQYINLPGSLPGYPRPSVALILIPRADHVAWEWPRELKELPTILNKLLDSLLLSCWPPGVCWCQPRSLARWIERRSPGGMAPLEELARTRWPGSCTPNFAPPPPHARGRGGTTRGSPASQPPPVVFRPYPPARAVGAGSGRVPGPKFAAWTAAGAAGGFLCYREGQKFVGFCPLGGAHQSAWSLYIVLGHTLRRRCPAGALRAISGNRSCLRRMHSLRAPWPLVSPFIGRGGEICPKPRSRYELKGIRRSDRAQPLYKI